MKATCLRSIPTLSFVLLVLMGCNPTGEQETASPEAASPTTASQTPATTESAAAKPPQEVTAPASEGKPAPSAAVVADEEPPKKEEKSAPAKDTVATSTPSKPEETPQAAQKASADEYAILVTEEGVIVIQLFEEDAPQHVKNFKKLISEGFYNDLAFHRVVEDFIAQGGDPKGDGTGGPGYTIAVEKNGRKHEAGSVAMALSHDGKSSNGSQFYICLGSHPELDEWGATVFGKVRAGLETAKRFQGYKRGEVADDGFLPRDRQTKILKTELVAAADWPKALLTSTRWLSDQKKKAATAMETSASGSEDEYAVLTTDIGDVVINLFEEDAPKHAENFKKLVREGFYNNLTFHRVIPGFMAQGGDPDGTGRGGPGYTLPAEIKRNHVRGSVAAARLGDGANPERRSSGSQFYICYTATPHLDGDYTVFGEVVKGMDVVDKFKKGQPPNFPKEEHTKIVSAKLAPAGSYK